MIYRSQDNRFGLQLEARIVNQMLEFIAKTNERETGGILIGFYNEARNLAIVESVSGPPNDSAHGFTCFKRGTRGLQRQLLKAWKRKEYYLGEWHYHPNASATPSYVDKAQMKEIANTNTYHCPEPILVIVGGSAADFEIKSFVFAPTNKLVELKHSCNNH
jgi:integrative and conjugative element protein (TIGR02256 family)